MNQSTLFSPAQEPTKSANLIFRNMEDIKAAIAEIKKEETTFYRLKELQNYFIENEEKTAAEIVSKLTIKEINTFIYSRPGSNKKDLVESMTEAISQAFDICEGMLSYSWTYGEDKKGNPRQEALKKRFDSTTPEMYHGWKDEKKAKAAAFKKAMENPETLLEFNTFIKRKGETALTTEQREIYDELRSGKTKEQRQQEAERRAQITAVAVGETNLIIIPTKHTKKGHDLWVVQLSERVERHIYKELDARAKQLGGYYSSFRGNGAIPGFTFDRMEAAELFIQIKDGDVNAIELRKAINADRIQQRAENLQTKAASMEESATEELNRDRKDNTVRRARMASSAERQAAAEIIFSLTLNKIAEAMQGGELKHIERLTSITQLEALERVLSRCKWDYIYKTKIHEDTFEFSPEVIDYTRYPYPTIYKHHILETLGRLIKDNGKKLAAGRMYKRIQGLKEGQEYLTVTEGRCLEDFKTLFLYPSKGIDRWQCSRYQEEFRFYDRIVRMGITDIYTLRAALRELTRIKEGVQLTDEQKKLQQIRELERKFVGKKIDGFFPTPEDLAAEVVEKANIQEGDRILEPSAGLGHLAEAITDQHPHNHLCCIEYHSDLAAALTLKGFNTLNIDFLSIAAAEPATMYDKIIMNPPFENLQDIDHVLNAWNLLKPGGRIVAIMAGNKTRETPKVVDFMQFVDQYGIWEPNPVDSFASAFRPTGVNTITVVLDKPAA